MRRLALALPVTLVLTLATSFGALGDTSGTPVVLSCNDGHSVALFADAATLSSLTADVQSINLSGTGLVCTIDTPSLDPSSETAEWSVYDYNPSGRGIHPRSGPNSMPATSDGGNASFQFISGTFTALLVTTSSAFTGDLSGKTVSVTVSWSQTGGFYDQNNGGCQPDLQSTRLYFESPSAAGPSTGSPPAGFYTQFWWSNPDSIQPSPPDSVTLAGDSGGPVAMSVSLSYPLTAKHNWSDWNGKFNDDSPPVTEGFIEATKHVQMIGLSFGGGCFFENGVSTNDGGNFTMTDFTVTGS
jgi:hypothetical protein